MKRQSKPALKTSVKDRYHQALKLIVGLAGFMAKSDYKLTDTTQFIQGICNLFFEMYHPLLVQIKTSGKGPSAYRLSRPLPPSFCNAQGEPKITIFGEEMILQGTPFYCVKLNISKKYRNDPGVKELKLKTCLIAPLRDSTGSIMGALTLVDPRKLTFDDIEIELFTVAALLVADRLKNQELLEIEHELETHLRQVQKMEAVGMLAGGIAHDFNNILSGILGLATYLKNKVEAGSDIQHDLELIELSSKRAAELTRRLVSFSKKAHIKKDPLSINQIIEEVIGLLQHSLAKDTKFNLELSPGLPAVLGDSNQLNQVFMNLCINGVEAVAEKQGVLRISSQYRPLNSRERAILADFKEEKCICITVSDNGKGMDQYVKQHIFDPFFTTKGKTGGSGLGMSIVFGIITNHGGAIRVESSLGKGSTFRIYLPASKEKIPIQNDQDIKTLAGNENIMVVDDDATVLETTEKVLRDAGYKVYLANSGQEAIKLFKSRRGKIDFVLLDLVMAGMDGQKVFTALRKIKSNLPIMLCTGFAQSDQCASMIKRGALGPLSKPWASRSLLVAVRRALDAKK